MDCENQLQKVKLFLENDDEYRICLNFNGINELREILGMDRLDVK